VSLPLFQVDRSGVGFDAEELPLCDRFDRLCFKDYPIECIGFSYCSERIAALKPKAEIDAVQSLFPVGVDATPS
jgi:hypothetical protein